MSFLPTFGLILSVCGSDIMFTCW